MSYQPNASLMEVGRVINPYGEPISSSHVDYFCAYSSMADCPTLCNTQAPTDKMVDDLWEILLSEVRTQLRASDATTRNYRAYELQLLASSEAVGGQEDIPRDYPMDLVTNSQPMYDSAVSYSVSSFMPFSPMRSSRYTTPFTTATSIPLKSNLTVRNQLKSSPIILVQHDQSTVLAEQCNDTREGNATFTFDSSGTTSQSTLPPKNKAEEHKPCKSADKSQRKMAAMPKPTTITRPSTYDVLSGRGGVTNKHRGNVWFRDEARKLRRLYRDRNTTRDEKMLLSLELVKIVKDHGGRFLAKCENKKMYYEIEDGDARRKALQALRENKWN